MRRISLAMALLGAVAATGCSGGNTPESSGTSAGSPGATFTVKVRGETYNYTDPVTNTSVARPVGGTITSTPPGINCGEGGAVCSFDFPWGTSVVIAASTTPMGFHAFAGDCSGTEGCTLSGNSDKLVLVRFAPTATGLGSHPNFSDAGIHGVEYMKLLQGQAGAFGCNTASCHGTALRGAGLAPSCYQCHDLPTTTMHAVAGQPWSSYVNRAGCQRCHTTGGFQDYIGLDGTPNYLGTTYNSSSSTQVAGTLQCWGCHNSASSPARTGLAVIQFPSPTNITTTAYAGAGMAVTYRSVTTDNVTALCGQCHQGRESTNSLNLKIGSTAADTVIPVGNSFPNPHYLGAAGTVFGTVAKMWGEYPGKVYTGANQHGVNEGKCTSCHDAHTGQLPADSQMAQTCGRCHFDETTGQPVASFLELEESRQFGFEGDVDGDGAQESLKHEIEGLEAKLYTELQAYATSVVGTSIIYNGAAHPYYYVDANADGVQQGYDPVTGLAIAGFDPTLAESAAYNKFTPRSLRAAFNLKWAHAEPGAWAHNPRYAIEILFDGILDLREGTYKRANTLANTEIFRSFDGHFGGARAAAPYRAMVYSAFPATSGFSSAACYQCHGGQGGFAQFLQNQSGAALTTANKVTGFQCTLCHAPAGGDANFKRIRSDVTSLRFPAQKAEGKYVTVTQFATPTDAVCTTCHAGRENKTTVDDKLLVVDPVNPWTYSFPNPHYLGAAGVLYGSTTHMLYEYEGNTYAGLPINWGSPHGSPHGGSCVGCHQPKASKHTFEVDLAYCNGCHVQTAYGDYRLPPKKANVTALKNLLYSTITQYATAAGKQLCYNGASHPYWFADSDADGTCSTAVQARLDAKTLKATFNYKWASAEPGAYAHNYEYVGQVLYDSIVDLNPSATFPLDAFFDPASGTTIVRPEAH